MSDIEDMLVADVRSLEESLSKERLTSWNWRQTAETQKARADRLEKLLREIANAGVFITCDTSRGIMARIDAELGA